MGKATQNAIAKRRLKKKAQKKADRRKEVKRLRHLGWPSRSSGADFLDDAEEAEANELEKRIEAATTMKALHKLATEYGIPKVRDYKAADRADLEEAIRDAATVQG
jgi:hypothetical protein